MDNKILILVVLIIIVGIITIGLIGWQTGFVVKNGEESKSKDGLKPIESDENQKQITSTPTITGEIIKITSRSSGGGSGGSGSDGSGTDDGTIPISQATVELSISPSSLTQQKDKEFIINVNIESQEKIYAAEFELSFNSQVLEVLEVVKGNFLGKDGADTYEVIKEDNGKITFASTRFGIQTGVSGEGNLAEIKFKAKDIGESNLILSNVKIADASLDADKFQANIKNGKVTIT